MFLPDKLAGDRKFRREFSDKVALSNLDRATIEIMRNPNEPSYGHGKHRLARLVLLTVAVLSGVFTLLMGLAFCWGLFWFVASADFAEGGLVVLMASTCIGVVSSVMTLIFVALAMRKRD